MFAGQEVEERQASPVTKREMRLQWLVDERTAVAGKVDVRRSGQLVHNVQGGAVDAAAARPTDHGVHFVGGESETGRRVHDGEARALLAAAVTCRPPRLSQDRSGGCVGDGDIVEQAPERPLIRKDHCV